LLVFGRFYYFITILLTYFL